MASGGGAGLGRSSSAASEAWKYLESKGISPAAAYSDLDGQSRLYQQLQPQPEPESEPEPPSEPGLGPECGADAQPNTRSSFQPGQSNLRPLPPHGGQRRSKAALELVPAAQIRPPPLSTVDSSALADEMQQDTEDDRLLRARTMPGAGAETHAQTPQPMHRGHMSTFSTNDELVYTQSATSPRVRQTRHLTHGSGVHRLQLEPEPVQRDTEAALRAFYALRLFRECKEDIGISDEADRNRLSESETKDLLRRLHREEEAEAPEETIESFREHGNWRVDDFEAWFRGLDEAEQQQALEGQWEPVGANTGGGRSLGLSAARKSGGQDRDIDVERHAGEEEVDEDGEDTTSAMEADTDGGEGGDEIASNTGSPQTGSKKKSQKRRQQRARGVERVGDVVENAAGAGVQQLLELREDMGEHVPGFKEVDMIFTGVLDVGGQILKGGREDVGGFVSRSCDRLRSALSFKWFGELIAWVKEPVEPDDNCTAWNWWKIFVLQLLTFVMPPLVLWEGVRKRHRVSMQNILNGRSRNDDDDGSTYGVWAWHHPATLALAVEQLLYRMMLAVGNVSICFLRQGGQLPSFVNSEIGFNVILWIALAIMTAQEEASLGVGAGVRGSSRGPHGYRRAAPPLDILGKLSTAIITRQRQQLALSASERKGTRHYYRLAEQIKIQRITNLRLATTRARAHELRHVMIDEPHFDSFREYDLRADYQKYLRDTNYELLDDMVVSLLNYVPKWFSTPFKNLAHPLKGDPENDVTHADWAETKEGRYVTCLVRMRQEDIAYHRSFGRVSQANQDEKRLRHLEGISEDVLKAETLFRQLSALEVKTYSTTSWGRVIWLLFLATLSFVFSESWEIFEEAEQFKLDLNDLENLGQLAQASAPGHQCTIFCMAVRIFGVLCTIVAVRMAIGGIGQWTSRLCCCCCCVCCCRKQRNSADRRNQEYLETMDRVRNYLEKERMQVTSQSRTSLHTTAQAETPTGEGASSGSGAAQHYTDGHVASALKPPWGHRQELIAGSSALSAGSSAQSTATAPSTSQHPIPDSWDLTRAQTYLGLASADDSATGDLERGSSASMLWGHAMGALDTRDRATSDAALQREKERERDRDLRDKRRNVFGLLCMFKSVRRQYPALATAVRQHTAGEELNAGRNRRKLNHGELKKALEEFVSPTASESKQKPAPAPQPGSAGNATGNSGGNPGKLRLSPRYETVALSDDLDESPRSSEAGIGAADTGDTQALEKLQFKQDCLRLAAWIDYQKERINKNFLSLQSRLHTEAQKGTRLPRGVPRPIGDGSGGQQPPLSPHSQQQPAGMVPIRDGSPTGLQPRSPQRTNAAQAAKKIPAHLVAQGIVGLSRAHAEQWSAAIRPWILFFAVLCSSSPLIHNYVFGCMEFKSSAECTEIDTGDSGDSLLFISTAKHENSGAVHAERQASQQHSEFSREAVSALSNGSNSSGGYYNSSMHGFDIAGGNHSSGPSGGNDWVIKCNDLKLAEQCQAVENCQWQQNWHTCDPSRFEFFWHVYGGLVGTCLVYTIFANCLRVFEGFLMRDRFMDYFSQLCPWPGMKAHCKRPEYGLLPSFGLHTNQNIIAWNKLRLYLQTYEKENFGRDQLVVFYVFLMVFLMMVIKIVGIIDGSVFAVVEDDPEIVDTVAIKLTIVQLMTLVCVGAILYVGMLTARLQDHGLRHILLLRKAQLFDLDQGMYYSATKKVCLLVKPDIQMMELKLAIEKKIGIPIAGIRMQKIIIDDPHGPSDDVDRLHASTIRKQERKNYEEQRTRLIRKKHKLYTQYNKKQRSGAAAHLPMATLDKSEADRLEWLQDYFKGTDRLEPPKDLHKLQERLQKEVLSRRLEDSHGGGSGGDVSLSQSERIRRLQNDADIGKEDRERLVWVSELLADYSGESSGGERSPALAAVAGGDRHSHAKAISRIQNSNRSMKSPRLRDVGFGVTNGPQQAAERAQSLQRTPRTGSREGAEQLPLDSAGASTSATAIAAPIGGSGFVKRIIGHRDQAAEYAAEVAEWMKYELIARDGHDMVIHRQQPTEEDRKTLQEWLTDATAEERQDGMLVIDWHTTPHEFADSAEPSIWNSIRLDTFDLGASSASGSQPGSARASTAIAAMAAGEQSRLLFEERRGSAASDDSVATGVAMGVGVPGSPAQGLGGIPGPGRHGSAHHHRLNDLSSAGGIIGGLNAGHTSAGYHAHLSEAARVKEQQRYMLDALADVMEEERIPPNLYHLPMAEDTRPTIQVPLYGPVPISPQFLSIVMTVIISGVGTSVTAIYASSRDTAAISG